jgi:flagellar hook protein FlgE
MKIMNPSAIAVQGLDQADAQLNAATEAIATIGTAAGGPNIVNLGADMISLTSAQTLYEVNIATLKTADQMEQRLIDLTA